ncbi:MAG: iron-siderophore ABC transporter substrate-binding protein [Cyanobacteria bacterium P01_H01_bin.58]
MKINPHHFLNRWQTFAQSIQVQRSLSVRRSLHRQRRFFLLMGVTACLTSACNSKAQTDHQSLTTDSSTVRQVQHAFGETEVPVHPIRVVVWGYTTIEAVVAHGIQPIGVPNSMVDEMHYLSLDRETITEIGNPGQPNLEKITALKPDLILTSKHRIRDEYSLLAQIAPTVVFDIDSNTEWKELTRLCGEALGKPAETEKLTAAYNAKRQEVRTRFSQNSKQFQVSVVYLHPEFIGTMGTNTFTGSVLADAGIARPPSQAQAQGPRNISLESLELLDGDALYIIRPQSNHDVAAAIRAEIDRIQAHPLWSQLNAVQTNQVYEVGAHWAIGSYIAANLILDDLLKVRIGSVSL